MQITKTANGYTLELSAEELHDLQVIAGIQYGDLTKAVRTSRTPWIDQHTQTHNLYGLVADLFDYRPPVVELPEEEVQDVVF